MTSPIESGALHEGEHQPRRRASRPSPFEVIKGSVGEAIEETVRFVARRKPDEHDLRLDGEANEILRKPLEELGYKLTTTTLDVGSTEPCKLTLAKCAKVPDLYLVHIPPEKLPETTERPTYNFNLLGLTVPRASRFRLFSDDCQLLPDLFDDWFRLWEHHNSVDSRLVPWSKLLAIKERSDPRKATITFLHIPSPNQTSEDEMSSPESDGPIAEMNTEIEEHAGRPTSPNALAPAGATSQPAREGVFISYSHDDKEWLARFRTGLKGLERLGHSVWDDTEILPGDQWRAEIDAQLNAAKVAVFLVSQNFENSDFITNDELGPAIQQAEEEGLKIFAVALSWVAFEDLPLNDYQWGYGPASDRVDALDQMQPGDWKKALVGIRRGLKKILDTG